MKLICGVARNSRGKFKTRINGQAVKAYVVWNDMIRRCYSRKKQSSSPTYMECIVCDEWLDYQVFADWYDKHEYRDYDYQLDKDILIPENKIYSPEYCCFVPHEINSLFTSHGAKRGEYPQGVYFHKASGKYSAALSICGDQTNLGLFNCPNEAYQAYKVSKEQHVKNVANKWRDRIAPEVYEALMSWELKK